MMRDKDQQQTNQVKKLHLIQPHQKMQQRFSSLRTQLKKQNIPFTQHFNFEQAKELMRAKQGKHIGIIDNQGIEEKDIPADLINTKYFQIYLYPKQMQGRGFQCLRNIGSVIKKVSGKKSQSKSSRKGIKLNSIKRQVSKSPDGKIIHPYQKLAVYQGINSEENKQYTLLLDHLNQQQKVYFFERKNKIGSFTQNTLLLTDINNLDQISKFIQERRGSMNKLDLAVLGLSQNNKRLGSKYIAIVTKDPIQMIQFFQSAGFRLPGAKSKLQIRRKILSQKQKIQSAKIISHHLTDKRMNSNDMGQILGMKQQSQGKGGLDLNSNIMNKKKVVKKKKVNTPKSSNQNNKLQYNQFNQMQSPKININRVNSDSDKNSQIYQSKLPKDKEQMHWTVKVQNREKGKPNFITQPSQNLQNIIKQNTPISNTSIALVQQASKKTSSSKPKNMSFGNSINQNNNIIPQLSQQYRGSNRQSFIVQQLSRNGMKFQDFQEDGMKKKANYSQFKGMVHDQNNQFQQGRRSSDLGIGVKNQIKQEIQIPTHNIIETQNNIKLNEQSKNSYQFEPQYQIINHQFERPKNQISNNIVPSSTTVHINKQSQNDENIIPIQNTTDNNLIINDKQIDNIKTINVQSQQQKPSLKIRKQYRTQILSEGPAKIQNKFRTVVKNQIQPQTQNYQNYQNSRKYVPKQLPRVQNHYIKNQETSKYKTEEPYKIKNQDPYRSRHEEPYKYNNNNQNTYKSNHIRYIEKQKPLDPATCYQSRTEIRQYQPRNQSRYINNNISSYRQAIQEDKIRPNPKPYSPSDNNYRYVQSRKAIVSDQKPQSRYNTSRRAMISQQKQQYRYTQPKIYQREGQVTYRQPNKYQYQQKNIRPSITQYVDKKTQYNNYDSNTRNNNFTATTYRKYQDYQQSKKNNNLYSGQYKKSQAKEKRDIILDSKNFNFDDYDRIVDEKGRVVYKPKKKLDNSRHQNLNTQIKRNYISSPTSKQIQKQSYANHQNRKYQSQRRLVSSNYSSVQYLKGTEEKPKITTGLSTQTANLINAGNYQNQSRQNKRYSPYRVRQYRSPQKYQNKDHNINSQKYYTSVYQTNQKNSENQGLVKVIRGGNSSRNSQNRYQIIQNTKYQPTIRYERRQGQSFSSTNLKNSREQKQKSNYIQSYRYDQSPLVAGNNFRNQKSYERNSLIGQYRVETSEKSKESFVLNDRSQNQYTPQKASNPHVYHQTKPFSSTNINRVENQEIYNKLNEEYKSLSTNSNCFHYLIDSDLGIKNQMQNLANLKDTIDICQNIREIEDKISKKSLPNTVYDLGFIFLTPQNKKKLNRQYLKDGYYIVDIDTHYRNIDINRERKQLKIAKIQNLILARKLLLGPLIQHILFYNNIQDSQVSKMLKIFPNNKFQKIKYSNRSDLQSLLNIHAKNKGRMMRIFIFVNEINIDQIYGTLDHHLNLATFTMICRIQGDKKKLLRFANKYPKIVFLNHSNYQSYNQILDITNQEVLAFSDPEIQQNQENKIIYLDVSHKDIKQNIQKNFPNKFQIKYFMYLDELVPNKNSTVILHPQADYEGQQIKNCRDYQCVYMLGNTKKVPSGAVRITYSDLISLLQ